MLAPMLMLLGTLFLEGPSASIVGYQALGSHNCQPVRGATLTRAWVFQHLADLDENVGVATVTACQFHAGDPLPKLTEGYWFTGVSTCAPRVAAFVAQWLFSEFNVLADGGCDAAGPQFASETAGVLRPTRRHVKQGICHVVNSIIAHCNWG